MEPVDHRLGVFQQYSTRLVVSRPHVHAITQHPRALLGRQQLQTSLSRFLVAACLHCQHLGILGIAQVGHDGHVQLVTLLQADLVHANVRKHTFGVDHQRLAVGQLVLDDEPHRVGGDAQATRHVRFGRTDEHA